MVYSACEDGGKIIKTHITEKYNSQTITVDNSYTNINEIPNVTLMSQS
jgi:hypothetical protein